MLAQGRLREAEHAGEVHFGSAVGGPRLGWPPLRVSRGPNRSSHWKIRRYRGLARPMRCDLVEASTVAVEHRLLAGKPLPSLHRNADITRRDFNRVAHPAGHLSGDYRRARAAERLVDGLPGRRIILDRPAHALDRLLRAVAGFRFQIFVDLPQRRLRMVAGPRRGATFAHHVPARLLP